MTIKLHFWLRDEVKPGERRTPILPEHALKLIEAGHRVTVEESRHRCVPNEAYKKVGCRLVPTGSWTQAPREAVILGIKNLPESDHNIVHRHVYFAHAYKNQSGWKELLSRFVRGEGFIWDLEYLSDDNGRRVAAFGRPAGFVGMAIGIVTWCHQQLFPDQPKVPALEYHPSFESLANFVRDMLTKAVAKAGRSPRIVVIGANGRCGNGASDLAGRVGLQVDKWGINETASGGPFPQLLDADIVLNGIYLFETVAPFITHQLLEREDRRLSVVVDVSCDPTNPANPLPIYSDITSFSDPATRVRSGARPVDVVAIDHLASLVAHESSKDFADLLIDHLVRCGETDVWRRCKQIFFDKCKPILKELQEERKHVWLRDEAQDEERRTPLTPFDARKLIEQGFRVTVEKSMQRVFTDEEYAKQGCVLIESGAWKDSAPASATILGLQGLPSEDQTPLKHRHMYFGYAFKEQSGWKELLSRFAEGGGTLIDLEYLTGDTGNRLATFARISGYISMAVGILVWCHQQIHPKKAESPKNRRRGSREFDPSRLASAEDIDKSMPLLEYIQNLLEKAVRITGQLPVPVVIGAKGRVGSGAVTFAQQLGLKPASITRADFAALSANSPKGIPKLLEFDILVNAIKLSGPISPILTAELLRDPSRELTVIVDASCDVYNPNNPLPIYNSVTTFEKPAQRLVDDSSNPLDLVAIENLAALLPRESSADFSAQLLPLLMQIADDTPIFKRAIDLFKTKSNGLKISVAAPTLALPTDYPKGITSNTSFQGAAPQISLAKESRTLPRELYDLLKILSESLSVGIENLLLAAFKTLLFRLTGEDDVMVGVLLLDQPTTGNIYSVRSNFAGNPTFNSVVAHVNMTAKLEEIRVMPAPLVDVNATLKQDTPKFQVLFGSIAGSVRPEVASLLDHFEASLLTSEENGNLTATFYYRTDIFNPARFTEMLRQLELLLDQITRNPTQQVQKMTLVTPAAKKVLADPSMPLDNTWFGSIHSHFSKSAARLPDKVALVHHQNKVTYRELDVLTSKLANYLVSNGIKPEDSIFIFGQRNLSMVWAVMGILKAGGAVSLMDPVYPADRIVNCLEVAQPRAWISVAGSGEIPSLVRDYLKTIGCNIIVELPLPAKAFEDNFLGEFGSESPNVDITPDNVAVVTFTSGSTGLPKGVLGRHGPLTHFYPWMKERFGLSESDHFTMCSGISHDPLQRDIFTPLFFGATLHIPNAEDIANPGQLAVWMKNENVTVTHLTPAMGQLLSETIGDTQVPSLRLSLLVGDKLTKRDVLRLRKVAPSLVVVNMYGSTETQRAVSYYVVPPNNELDRVKEILPSGQGMKDVQLLIFNADQQPVGVGEIGEVYVRSPHLAKGYKGLPEQTAAKFLKNPYTSEVWDRMYRTGDLGRYRLDGSVEITGRADNQVKIRGFRIELGEINTMLSSHKAVKENVPLVREDVPGDKRIVAYVVPHQGHLVPPGHELRRFLENKLPYYMIPSAFIVMKSLPLTPNGKINTGGLPAPERVQKNRIDRTEPLHSDTIVLNEKSFAGFWKEMFPHLNLQNDEEKAADSPFSETEAKIAGVWTELLGTSNFGAKDNFFDLGGHSLVATKAISQLRRVFSLDLPTDMLLKNPTVETLAKAILRYRDDPTSASATNVNFDAEVLLEDSVRPPPNSSYDGQCRNVFLTGCTGFLGIFLLREVLDQTAATIYCLVRASTRLDGRERIVQNLKIHKLWKDSYESRIIPIPGDLTKRHFGIPQDEYEKLSREIDVVIHNAALVHWIFPYEQMKPHNVIGTLEALRLATAEKLKAFHHVSTTSVFDSDAYAIGATSRVMENDALQSHHGLSGGYPQSKWVAERLVMEARSRGVPANIYRPGYISGDTTHGIWTTDDFLCRLLKGCIQLGAFPHLQDGLLDICTVDYVSGGIVHISQQKGLLNGNYHMINPNPLPYGKFFEAARAVGYPMESVDFSEWRRRLLEHTQSADNFADANALAPVVSVFQDGFGTQKHAPFDLSNTLGALADTGVALASIEAVMPLYFSYFIRSGFLGVPNEVNAEFQTKWLAREGTVDLITRTNRGK